MELVFILIEVCINRVISAILSIRSWIYTKIEKKCLSIAENNVKTAEKCSLKHAVKKMAGIYASIFPPIDALPPLPL
ncbi:hypothetical protein [Treponema socranskii]|uniref:hypothetical protein n=1 Tax=Treponema socranskii TaxID=53419 RepID=UPI0028E60725|nr:hypothetical protein [Treponema socranskii]